MKFFIKSRLNREDMEWANDVAYKIRLATGLLAPLSLLALKLLFHIPFPMAPLFLIGFFEAFINQPYSFIRRKFNRLERLLYLATSIDVVAITFFIHYSGGLELPFTTMLYLVPIIFATTDISVFLGIWLATLSSMNYCTLLLLEHNKVIEHIESTGLLINYWQLVIFCLGTIFFFYLMCYFANLVLVRLRKRGRELQKKAHENARLYRELRQSYINTVESLAVAVNARDNYTEGHLKRVCDYTVAIARHMKISNERIENLRTAAMLHDIGKIGISDSILLKPDRLTNEEWEKMKEHSVISERIVKPIGFPQDVAKIIRHHHERYDGKGYPDGTKGEELLLEAYILGAADSFDAMTTNRPYAKGSAIDRAKDELKRCSGTQFHPDVSKAFIEVIEKGKIGISN